MPEKSQTARTVACPSCGKDRLIEGMRFCDNCGSPIPSTIFPKPVPREKIPARTTEQSVKPSALTAKERKVSPSSQGLAYGKAKTDRALTTLEQMRFQGTPRTEPQDKVTPRQRIVGVFLVVFGIAILLASLTVGAANLGGIGLASFLIGFLLVYLPSRPIQAPELVGAATLSSLRNLERILGEFGPDTRARYLRVRDRLDVPLVFLPLSDNPASASEVPLREHDRFLVIDSEDPHKAGLLLEAPGASLLALMERESGLDFFDVAKEELLEALRSCMTESLEAVADLKGVLTEESLKLRMKDGALNRLSQEVAKSAPRLSERLGCPICSGAICACVKSLKRDLILSEVEHQPGYHEVVLDLLGDRPDEPA